MKDITILVPVLNEEEALPIFLKTADPVMKNLGLTYEYLFVDDGSTDATPELLKKYSRERGNVRYISLSRNFGQEAALLCGLRYAETKAVVVMDIDLQDPPELIKKFTKKWREGYEMVYGIRADRNSDSFFKRVTSAAFYRVYNMFAKRRIAGNTGVFRLMDKKVVDAVKQIKEHTLFLRGVFSWAGFKSIGVEYTRPKRSAGITKWNYWKLWNFALDGIFNSSTVPLRIWTYFGVLTAFCAFLYSLFIITRTLMFGRDVPGYASLIVLILFFGGVQLISVGMLGEYIGRIFAETRNRPLYVVKEISKNLTDGADNAG